MDLRMIQAASRTWVTEYGNTTDRSEKRNLVLRLTGCVGEETKWIGVKASKDVRE